MQHEENDKHLSKKNSENKNSLHASICLDNTLYIMMHSDTRLVLSSLTEMHVKRPLELIILHTEYFHLFLTLKLEFPYHE